MLTRPSAQPPSRRRKGGAHSRESENPIGVTAITGPIRQGRVLIQSLDVAHPEGITGRLLRSLPLERIESMHKGLRRSASWYGKGSAKPQEELLRVLGAGPPRGSDRIYKAVARVYLADVRNGVRNPALHISNDTAVPAATVRGWIHRARLLGYLPPARRGAAG